MASAVFAVNPDGTYDLEVSGRKVDYDVPVDELADSARRARLDPRDVQVEDALGYREPLVRRR